MTDYTPTTEQVRDAYVRGMRDTFIASAGEHREEFDRWVQAREAEVRASVQPPTREQIAEAIAKSQDGHYWVHEIAEWEARKEWEHEAYADDRPESAYQDRDSYLKDADAVLALFPQPIPSAEQIETLRQLACDGSGVCQSPLHAHGCYSDLDGSTCDEPTEHPPAEPVSVADMAPGTRLVGRTRDGVLSTIDRTWIVTDDHHVFSTGAHLLVADRIDPSTIRNVTPPAATTGEGDRG